MEKGLRVLLSKPDRSYSIGPSNPAVGSKWECTGTIIYCGLGRADVKWDKGGYTNSYKDNELSAVYEGRCKSIW
jgi:hypothetical protein